MALHGEPSLNNLYKLTQGSFKYLINDNTPKRLIEIWLFGNTAYATFKIWYGFWPVNQICSTAAFNILNWFIRGMLLQLISPWGPMLRLWDFFIFHNVQAFSKNCSFSHNKRYLTLGSISAPKWNASSNEWLLNNWD